MAEPSLALHNALFAAMSALSCGAYDGVPQGAAFPYVTLDTQATENADRLNARSDERFIYFRVWSRSRGQEEVLGILGELDALFDDASLTLATGEVASCRPLRAFTQRDADNETFGGSFVLRVLTNH